MPLTPRKIAHLQANVPKTFAGRAQPVILTMRATGGGTTTLTVNAILRVQGDFDPTLEGAQNTRFHIGATEDVQAEFNAADVTLTQLRATIWVSLKNHTGAEPAQKYVILDIEPIGIPVGSSRFFVKLSRQH